MTDNCDEGVCTIALDAMGGDCAPEAIICGAELVLSGKVPCEGKVHFSIYGKQEVVMPVLAKCPLVQANSVLIDTPDVVLSTDRPSYALRHRKRSSMWGAIGDVKKGVVSAAVSSGNTGALMAISRYILGTIHGIDRPAIATSLPSKGSSFVLLDLGANVDCSADALLQFAIMGSAYAKVVLGRENPKVGLLNIGEEEVKGSCVVQEACVLFRAAKASIMDFYGYVEAEEAFNGEVDVVVADGFSGNIMLKAAEAVASTMYRLFKEAAKSSIMAMIGACLLGPSLKRRTKNMDPKVYNGAMFLGLNGVVVKSHGNAGPRAFAHAIKSAVSSVRCDIVTKIASEISKIG